MNRRRTAKFTAGCLVWVLGSFITAMAYNRLSAGLGASIWVDAFIIVVWFVLAYTIIWGEVFIRECDCECHDSSRGYDADSVKSPSAEVSEGGTPGARGAADFFDGVGAPAHEARTSKGVRKAGRHMR